MSWHTAPRFDAAALVTIDVQRDTLDGRPLEIPGTSAALAAMAKLAQAFRRAGRPIVHVVRLYREDGSNVDLSRRALVEGGARILAPGDEGAELAPGLAPDGADHGGRVGDAVADGILGRCQAGSGCHQHGERAGGEHSERTNRSTVVWRARCRARCGHMYGLPH